MTALAAFAPDPARPARIAAKSFTAFRSCPDGGKTYPLGEADAATVEEALNFTLANSFLAHKDHLVIREVDRTAEHVARRLGGGVFVRLHVFAVKKRSAPSYAFRDHAYHREHQLYAAPVCVFDEPASVTPDPAPLEQARDARTVGEHK